MDISKASVLPQRAATVEEARQLAITDGAALLSGFGAEEEVIAYGQEFLGERFAVVRPQFVASPGQDGVYRSNIERGVPDELGRTVPKITKDEALWVHNDGKSFGDYSPEYIFLWCQEPCPEGGESVLVDGLKLLELLAEEPEYADLVEFAWNTPINVSEAFIDLPEPSTIARPAPKGGFQVRCHYNLRAVPGPDAEAHQALIDQWVGLIRRADDEANTFRLAKGDVALVDNYRLLHGRRAYVSSERSLLSTWAWSDQAFGVPLEKPDFNKPEALVAV